MKRVFKVAGVAAAVIVLLAAAGLFFLTRGLEEGAELVVEDIDFSQKEDGSYLGSIEFYRWNNEVEVIIKNGKVSEIIANDQPREKQDDAIRELTDSVIEGQSTQVEVVSGATVTSKTYLKAIENAMK
ncbi:MAG: FMN-binding protein [Tindallia sp. MSAO_Bac2]|nr:MAG: FMN-binding protein [Tindallia sp. MSAO_Bac2]